MPTSYEQDVIVWANEQANLLRAGRFDAIDIAHIAEEIEDVGKSEQRELASRAAVLLAHLLKWQFQPERRSKSWQNTICAQRKGIMKRLQHTPSLKVSVQDPEWWDEVWQDAIVQAYNETGLAFPDACLWTSEQVFSATFLPE